MPKGVKCKSEFDVSEARSEHESSLGFEIDDDDDGHLCGNCAVMRSESHMAAGRQAMDPAETGMTSWEIGTSRVSDSSSGNWAWCANW